MSDIDANLVARALARPLSVVGFRNQAMGSRNPLSGEGARRFGRRFNPPQSYPVVETVQRIRRRSVFIMNNRKRAKHHVAALGELMGENLFRTKNIQT